MSIFRTSRRRSLLTLAFLTWVGPAAAEALRPADARSVYALVIGVDDYRNAPHLKGAAADAKDIAATLRQGGVADVKLLVNDQVSRKSVMQEFGALLDRVSNGDIVYLTVAGYGGSDISADASANSASSSAAFLLPKFNPKAGTHDPERIDGQDFQKFIEAVEHAGGRVVFVADMSLGYGLARSVDQRASDLSFRSVALTSGKAAPASGSSTPGPFIATGKIRYSTLLFADDPSAEVPEVNIPAVGYRGALSYAFARALEGYADLDRDGHITTGELFTYAQRLTYQLTDGRQHIVTWEPADTDAAREVVSNAYRGISIQKADGPPRAAQPVSDDDDSVVVFSVNPSPQAQPPKPVSKPVLSPSASGMVSAPTGPIQIAVTDDQAAHFNGIVATAPFSVVSHNAHPDLVWDASSGDALASGDVIAHNVEKADISSVIDRMAAIRSLKLLAARGPQDIRILPGDDVHNKGSRIEIEVGSVAQRSLVIINIAGNGTIQLLYPLGSDPRVLSDSVYRLPLQVREPFGADQIVAISSGQPMAALENAIRQLDRQRAPMKLVDAINKSISSGALVGLAGLFTTP